MVKHRVSNDEVMLRFKQIEELKQNSASEETLKGLRDRIVEDLSFLVYRNTSRYKRFPNYEDLNQEGFIGLIKAVNRFEYTRFPNFFVFANQWIINSIKRSAKKHDVVYNPNRNRVVYSSDDTTLNAPSDELDLECLLFDKQKYGAILDVVVTLSPRDNTIISSLFGINTKEHTLRETEKYCDLTYERIRQIKNKVITRLRSNKLLIELNNE